MVNSNRLFCRLDSLSPTVREQQRVAALEGLELLETETIPVFDEATQTAASFLEAPICIFGLMVQEQLWLKSAVGLSKLGFMNQLATQRKLPRQDSFCTYVVDSHQSLAINDTLNHPVFASSGLVQHYNVRAYLGTPLIASSGHCIGALAVMDLASRQFTNRDAEFLALTARWCLSEFERNRLLQTEPTQGAELKLIAPSPRTSHGESSAVAVLPDAGSGSCGNFVLGSPATCYNGGNPRNAVASQVEQLAREEREEQTRTSSGFSRSANPKGAEGTSAPVSSPQSLSTAQDDSTWTSTSKVKVKLLEQLTEKLRTPLTSVIGMASVLQRGVYGSLTAKQKEYLAVIYNSGQQMLSLVEEIVNLGGLSENSSKVELNPVDLEMLCQQVFNDLDQVAKQQQQELHLSIEPGNRIWELDKEKVRYALYYLMISMIESSTQGAQVRVHVSWRRKTLLIAVWVSHPWLGNGSQVNFTSGAVTRSGSSSVNLLNSSAAHSSLDQVRQSSFTLNQERREPHAEDDSRELLGLLLSCHLVELHGGKITVQGTPESGYRYTIQLPKVEEEK